MGPSTRYPPLRLRAMRVERGISARTIARHVGLSESRIRQAEREIASPRFVNAYLEALVALTRPGDST
jgi:transcriptional regulator with XRE-family HTH domain